MLNFNLDFYPDADGEEDEEEEDEDDEDSEDDEDGPGLSAIYNDNIDDDDDGDFEETGEEEDDDGEEEEEEEDGDYFDISNWPLPWQHNWASLFYKMASSWGIHIVS